MANAVQTLVTAWRQMGLVQRVLVVSVVLASAAAAWLLVDWARQPHMALLYAGLDPKDAADVVAKVQDAGVPYALKDGGTSIYVPAEKVYSLRLELAGAGLPAGGAEGYRILDEERIGASPFTQHVNYIRALEGELARSIALIDAVAQARVHIVRPESRLFRQDDAGASATVVVKVRPGRTLSTGNVAAIVHMVAGSVDRLAPENVVVVDSHGTLLSAGGEGGFAGAGGTVLDYKSRVERYLARKAEEMLTRVLGPGRAIVKVDAQVETSTINSTEERYNPDGQVATREETTSKTETPPAGASGAAVAQKKEETITTEYQVGRTLKQTIEMPGKIVSVSVAAFVDLSPPDEKKGETEGAEAGAAKPAGPPLTTQDVEEVIRRVLGLKETDDLKVVACSFNRPEVEATEAEETAFLSDPQFYLQVARHASVAVLVVGGLVMLKWLGGSKRPAPTAAAGSLPAGEDAAGGAGEAKASGGAARRRHTRRSLLPPGALDFENADPNVLNERITAALQANPEEVKRLFRTWVEQQQGAV